YVIESGSNGYSALRIDPVRDRDNNTDITCVVSNVHGSETASAKLVVISPENLPTGFPRIVEDPRLRAVEKGSSETMTCNARGDKPLTVLWLKNFLPVDMNNRRYSVSTIGNPGNPRRKAQTANLSITPTRRLRASVRPSMRLLACACCLPFDDDFASCSVRCSLFNGLMYND
ncbi:unnamed protein product, partial [Soboliphyme baturini]|uniref:Ig-like domain-containing protein n=1 Tax=Soboliphyme baturini TaxID=241478 RepID=A0A183J5D5_9BILA